MFKKLLGDSVVYGLTGMISKGMQVILIPIYTRMFTPAEYGVIDLLIVFASLVNLTVALEISQGVARYYGTSDSKEEKKQYASTAVLFSIGAYLLFFIVALGLSGWLSSRWLGGIQWKGIFVIAGGAMALNGVYILILDLLRWQHKPKFFALTSILYTFFTLMISLYFVVLLKSGIVGVFYGQIAGAAFGVLFILNRTKTEYNFYFHWDKCKVMLKYSFPLVFSSIAVFINLNVDRIAINELMTVADVGVYGVGFRIASLISIIFIGIQASLTPLVFQNYKKESTPIQLASIFRYFLIVAFGAILILGVFPKEIVSIFSTLNYFQAASVVPILALSFLFSNLYIFSPGLYIANKTKLVAAIGVSVAIMNIFLNILLIPQYGIAGAAIATCLSAVVGCIVILLYSQIYYRVPYDWRRLIISFCVLFFSISISSACFNENSLNLSFYEKFLFVLLITFFNIIVLLKRNEPYKILQLWFKKVF